jgi:hypothetical protein
MIRTSIVHANIFANHATANFPLSFVFQINLLTWNINRKYFLTETIGCVTYCPMYIIPTSREVAVALRGDISYDTGVPS